jgi:hypothetical protein
MKIFHNLHIRISEMGMSESSLYELIRVIPNIVLSA